MKWCIRSVVLVSILFFMAGCGGEGEQGPPGEDADVQTQRVDDHDECPGAATEILIDGEVTAVVCDGESGPTGDDGQDGEDGETPEVTTERHDDHDECPAGGVDILVDGEVETVVCDGEDGEGQIPEISIEEEPDECGDLGGVAVTIGDEAPFVLCNGEQGDAPEIEIGQPDNCGDAGGYSITVGDADPIDVCNGADGQDGDDGQDGQDGEDGFSPNIDVVELDPDPTGPCVEGGVELTITSQDASGNVTDESVIICAGGQPLPDPEISFCNVSYPEMIEQNDDESTTVYGHIEVDGYTGEQGGQLPDEYGAELGWGDVGVEPSDADWDWKEAELDEDFDWDDNRDAFMADLGPVDAGDYDYLYRMTVDGQEWTYCGLEGMFDLADYDADVDAGFMEVSEAASVIVHWDFDAEDEEDRLLSPPVGNGWARFSDGTFEEPVGGSTFFGPGGSHWAAAGYWSEDSEFPDSEFDDREFFEFNSEDFSEFDQVSINADFQRSSTGPAQAQIVAEFDDGTVAHLPDALDLPSGSSSHSVDASSDVLVAFDGGVIDADDEIESFRVYGFDSGSFGGSENMRVEDIEFVGN